MKKIFIFVFTLFVLCPFNVFALEGELVPNGKNVYLIEANSGKVLYSKNIHDRVSVASMTKMVAQIIILEKIEDKTIKWDDIVTVSKNASSMGGSQIYIETGEKITVRDLMKGISMASGNDATVAMAEYISGSEEKFVSLMNKRINELNLKDTHFMNCTGLDQENHYSSAYDMGVIAKELVVNHPLVLEFSSLYEDYLREDTDNKFWLVNTNKLIRFYNGSDGLKTGHTDAAGYCLAATAKRNGIRLIGIVLGETDSKIRNSETMNLLDYGFNNLKSTKLINKDKIIKKINVAKADKKYIDVSLDDDLIVVTSINQTNKKYNYSYKIDSIKLPIKKGDKVGTLFVKDNKKIIMSSKLISTDNVNCISYFDLFFNTLIDSFTGNL